MEQDTPLDEDWAAVKPAPLPPEPPNPEVEARSKLQVAADCYRRRKARREHPGGYFDRQQRWYPSGMEEQDCCRNIRSPSVQFPYSLMTHCRTIEHVARRHGVDPQELREFLKPPKVPKTKNPHRRLRGPTLWDKLVEDDPTENPSSDASAQP